MKNILLATNDKDSIDIIRNYFYSDHFIKVVNSNESCYQAFKKKRYDFLFMDLDLLGTANEEINYRLLLKPFWNIFPNAEIIIITTQEKIRTAVEIVKAGASDYLTYPLNPADVQFVVERLNQDLKVKSELEYLRDQYWQQTSYAVLRTNSALMKEVFSKVRDVSLTDSTVLISGETGTGKGIIANLIHQHSTRIGQPYIAIHCGAIPETLLESELFGHEKGAFTGAIKRKLGKFEIAHGGTIFLDEVGTIPSSMQIKLLQVLQEKVFQRVGGEITIQVDVRIIAATNSNLSAMSEAKLFREDLFYRLNVFEIELPPLRERLADIPLLVEHFLKKLNKRYKKNIYELHQEVLEAFQSYRWPGNIRELENLVERAYILEKSSTLTPNSFPIRLFKGKFEQFEAYHPLVDISKSLEEVRQQAIQKSEKEYLTEVLKSHHGKIKNTAKSVRITERQLHNLMVKYNLRKEDFKPVKKI